MSGHKARTSLLGGQKHAASYQPLDPEFQTGGYHDRQGLTSTPAKTEGVKEKMYWPTSTWTWSFLICALGQAVAALALECFVFGEFQVSLHNDGADTTQGRTISAYLSLFIFGFVYQLGLIYDALRLKNTIQVIGLCLYNFGLMIYAAVQKDQIHDAVSNIPPSQVSPNLWPNIQPYLIAVPCVIALGSVLLSLVAWKLYDEFAWTIYKHISADVQMKRRYLAYQIYISLLKFDFFFFLSFTVQFLVVVNHTANVESILTIVAIPVTVIILFAAAYITRRESFTGMCIIIVLYFAAMAYFLFKLVRMYDTSDPARVADYMPARRGLTLFAVMTILLLILTIANAMWCTSNFNKGLKPHIQRRKVMSPEDKQYAYEGNTSYNGGVPLGTVTTRMTID